MVIIRRKIMIKEEVLKVLKESDTFVSGQSLCDSLNVSRTAVWKCINQLKTEGYVIEAVTNKGYRLMQSPDLITEGEIKSLLNTKFWGQELVFFEETDSTNNVIKKMAEEGAPEGQLAIAEIQTGGRGRRGRSWSSPKGSGIWMSFLLRPQIDPMKASMLTIVAAMAAREAVAECSNVEAYIKWPNDIVVNGHKICGILTELSAEMHMINYVVIGVGINVNTTEFPEEIKDTASSLFIETGKKCSRSRIIAAFGSAFEKYYELFLKNENLSDIVNDYDRYLVNINRKVKIIENSSELIATAEGINEEGELLVTDDAGNRHVVRTGEVSVRGIYGYV